MMMNHRETEKYTKGFILKCMNVIIESRLGEMVVRKCSPTRNDWFNIALNDNEEVSTSCLECLDNLHWIDTTIKEEVKLNSGFTIDSRWKVTCEVSLKTNEGKTLSLEYWMFENKPINNVQSPISPTGASSPLGASPISDPTSGSPIPSSRNASSFANVHSKMGLMIKSLMSLARGTPSFKLSNVGLKDQSHIICYRICQCDVDFNTFLKSINPEIADDIHKQFSPETKLGSIRTNNNSIDVSFCYRVNLETCRLLDPVTTNKPEDGPINIKEDHFGGGRIQEKANTTEVDRNSPCFVDKAREPRLAFGSISPIVLPFPLLPPLPKDFPGISDESDNDDDLLGSCFMNNRKTLTPIVTPTNTTTNIIDTFSGKSNTITPTKTTPTSNFSGSTYSPSETEINRNDSPTLEKKVPNASKPIVIPSDRRNNNYRQPCLDNSPEPVGSGESYVFVDNRPPFAPDHDDIEILFTGPTPSFVTNPSGGSELLNIQQTLDAMEIEMLSIDDFLESLEIKSGEEDDDDDKEEEEEEEEEKEEEEEEKRKDDQSIYAKQQESSSTINSSN